MKGGLHYGRLRQIKQGNIQLQQRHIEKPRPDTRSNRNLFAKIRALEP